MKTHFLLIFVVFLLVPAQAVTIQNSRFIADMPVDSSANYVMNVVPDQPYEKGVVLTVDMDEEGNCSQWVSLSHKTVMLDPAGTEVTAVIAVPPGSTNGYHECFVQYTSPPGKIQTRLQAPVRITVSGGIDAPTPEITVPTVQPVEEWTAQTPITSTPAPSSRTEVNGSILSMIGGICVLAVVFVLVIVYDIRRARK